MTWNEETRILKADEGKWITNDGENFAIEAKLAPSESVENWWEVDELPPMPENNDDVLRGTLDNEAKIDYLADEYEHSEPEE